MTDDDGGRFTVDSTTGIVTVAGAIDREADGAARNITVRATSSDGSESTQTFTVNVNDVDEFDVGPVTDIDASANEISEDASEEETLSELRDALVRLLQQTRGARVVAEIA